MPFYSSQSFSESRLFSPSLMQSRLPINPSPSFLQSGLPPSDFTGKKFYIKVFFYQNSSFMFYFVLMYSKSWYFYLTILTCNQVVDPLLHPGLEYAAADMSMSALYLHNIQHRNSHKRPSLGKSPIAFVR